MTAAHPLESKPAAIGWHDSHSASVAAVTSQGHILFAAAEERYTKKKLQKGHPGHALTDLQSRFNIEQADRCYVDQPPMAKWKRNLGLLWSSRRNGLNCEKSIGSLVGTMWHRVRAGHYDGVVGVPSRGEQRQEFAASHHSLCEHHTAHAASAYYLSGFESAYVVTVDGVGDCLSGTIFRGVDGQLHPIHQFYYNELTVGADYETLTAMLGFNPDRHCGKVTGLAAFGTHNHACIAALSRFFESSWKRGSKNFFDRMHGSSAEHTLDELRAIREELFSPFSREDLAYAIQHLAEDRLLNLLREHIPRANQTNIALAGGVFANVRINQKIKQLGFANIFIAPPMDDGGLSVGAALWQLSRTRTLKPHRVPDMFLGPGYADEELRDVLEREGTTYERVSNISATVAKLIADGCVVGRFDGRMEFGPRALGNRSILYDTRDPSVNQWLNKRLHRTEFMPFAPATLADRADECYQGLDGCRHAAEFMTITFDCTARMKTQSPAVVHVDGTARAQLVTQEANPGFYEIIDEYRKITGIPSIVNTSFNMHESPIVRTPLDAVRTFQDGRLDYLAIGPFLAQAGNSSSHSRRSSLQAEPIAAEGIGLGVS